nr:MAG TPA: hypothetical protein [Caudoviricetes sp.]
MVLTISRCGISRTVCDTTSIHIIASSIAISNINSFRCSIIVRCSYTE